ESRRRPIAQAIAADGAAAAGAAAPAPIVFPGGRALQVEHGAGDARFQPRVLARRDTGDREDALREAVEIDLHGRRTPRRAIRLRLRRRVAALPRLAP